MRTRLARRPILPILLFALARAGSAFGQTVPNQPSWGGTDKIFHSVHYSNFSPDGLSDGWDRSLINGLGSPTPGARFTAALNVPTGVLLTDLELDYIEPGVSGSVVLSLFSCQVLLASCALVGEVDSDDGPGGRSFVVDPLNHTVGNGSERLVLTATLSGSDARLLGAYVAYTLQVSPAPASATFADVPTTHPFFRFVEALVASGITAGCGGGNYCVNAPITRGEMAVFLSVALGLHFPG